MNLSLKKYRDLLVLDQMEGKEGVLMLILTRRVGEALMIGNTTKVVVLGVKGGQIRLGINAPKEVEVHREEIFDKIKNEKEETPSSSTEIQQQDKEETH